MTLLFWLRRQGACCGLVTLFVLFLFASGAQAQTYQHLLSVNFGSGTKTGLSVIGNTTNDVWNLIANSNYSTTTNLSWATGSNSDVSITITNLPNTYHNYNSDVMIDSYLNGTAFDFDSYTAYPASLVVSNLPAGTYNFYFYAIGQTTYVEREGFALTIGSSTTSTKWTNPDETDFDVTSEPLAENLQYVVFTNLTVTSGQFVFVDMTGIYTHTLNGLQIIDLSSTNNTTLPSVTFDPVGGTSVPVTVTMYVTNHSGATIYYTTDGSTPTTSSTVYSSPVSISAQTTVKAFATLSGYTDSAVSTATYPLPTLPAVTFSPSDGSSLPASVTLAVPGVSGATIYYTTDGSTPTTSSAVYSGAVSLDTNSWSYSANVVPTMTGYTTPTGNTITYSSEQSGGSHPAWKAFDHSNSSYWMASSTSSEWVAIQFPGNRTVSKYALTARNDANEGPLTWTLEGWNGSAYVTLDSRTNETDWAAGERREYTVSTNGAYGKYRVSITSGTGSGHIALAEVEMYEAYTTLEAFATKSGYMDSSVSLAQYYPAASALTPIAPVPVISPSSGENHNDVSVTLSSALSGASYHYTTNGTDWVDYTAPVSVDRNTTFSAYATKSGYADSAVHSATYTFSVAPTSFSPNGGAFTNSVDVTLANSTTGASLQYTTNGTDFVTYSDAFTLTNTTTVTVIASRTHYTSSTNSVIFTAVDTSLRPLINVNFGSGTKTGYSAYGYSSTDVWNTVTASMAGFTNLLWMDGSTSSVSLSVNGLPSSNSNGNSDAMLGTFLTGYLYDGDYNPVYASVTVTNLPAGTYSFYLYGIGNDSYYESSGFQLTVGSGSPTSWKYTGGSFDTSSEPLTENEQYVVFTNITVTTGDVVTINLQGNYDYDYIFNGMQIAAHGVGIAAPVVPAPSVSPAGGTFTSLTTVNFTDSLPGANYRYTTNNTDWVTNSSVVLGQNCTLQVQGFKASYTDSVIVTNAFSVTLPTANSPVAIPPGNSYAQATTVTLFSSLSGASYRYSTNNGSTWHTGNSLLITTNTTLIAQTFKYGYQDSALVTNTYTIDSSASLLSGSLLNINLGTGTETGYAAYGNSSTDVWNTVSASSYSIKTNLVWANSGASAASLLVTNLPNSYSNGNADAMLGSYIDGTSYGYDPITDEPFTIPASVAVQNLPAGNYDVYLYGVDSYPIYQDAGFQLVVGNGSPSSWKYTNPDGDYFDPSSEPLAENLQYVVFTNITITAGSTLTVNLTANYNNEYVFNGLQLVNHSYSAQLPSVTFSPASGATVSVDVSLSVPNNSDATIYYTTDGSTPTTNSTVYSSAISLSTATTVKAIAAKTGYANSAVASASYVLPQLPSVGFSPATGATVPVDVTLSVSGVSGATIYYTLDGSTPTTSSSVYSSAISLSTATTIKAFATQANYLDAGVSSAGYVLPTAPNPTASPVGSTNHNAINVTLSSTLSGATLKFSTDNGTTWTDYSGAVALDGNVTLLAKTTKSGYVDSGVVTNVYKFVVYPTSFSPNGGTFTNSVSVTLADDTTGSALQYSTNGTDFVSYSSAFTLINTTTVTAIASKANYTSVTNSFTFVSVDPNSLANYGLINVNFGNGTKTGAAAVGINSDDYWNLIGPSGSTTRTNILWANGFPSVVSITLTNLLNLSSNLNSDAMLGSYLNGPIYDQFYNDIPESLTISNLPPATYNFYFYSAGAYPPYEHEGFNLTIGTNSTSTKWTSGTDYNVSSEPLAENLQYVVFTNLTVTTGQVVSVSMSSAGYSHTLNGLQIISTANTNETWRLPPVVFNPASGTPAPLNVSMSVPAHPSAVIYYTTDGSAPTSSSSIFTSAVSISSDTTIKAIASQFGYASSDVAVAQYLEPQAPSPTVSPSGGTNSSAITVTLACELSGATIKYSTNGGANWINYSAPFNLDGCCTLLSQVSKSGYSDSPLSVNSYYFIVSPSVISPNGGMFTNSISVSLSNATVGAAIHYHFIGSDSYEYSGPITLTNSTILTAIGSKSGYIDSVVDATFTSSTKNAEYIITDLGSGIAWGINDFGQVVGQTITNTAFSWVPSRTGGTSVGKLDVIDMLLSAYSVNNLGHIAGEGMVTAFDSTGNPLTDINALKWTENGIEDLTPSLNGPMYHYSFSSGIAINNNDDCLITGYDTQMYDPYTGQFVLLKKTDLSPTEDWGPQMYPSEGNWPWSYLIGEDWHPNFYNSHAGAVNDNRQVAGQAGGWNLTLLTNGVYEPFFRAVVWSSDLRNGIYSIGVLNSTNYMSYDEFSSANGINNFGTVVGLSSITAGSDQRHAFKWVPFESNGTNGVMSDLGVLPDSVNSEAIAINDSAIVVGSSDYKAFVYDSGVGMRDINQLITTNSGWLSLVSAKAINSVGQIVGYGTIIGDTNTHGFLLTPIKSTEIGVKIASHTNGQYVLLPSDVTLTADAVVSNAVITSVDFYVDYKFVGSSLSSPFSVVCEDLEEKQHVLYAVAHSSVGGAAYSDKVWIYPDISPIAIAANCSTLEDKTKNITLQGYDLLGRHLSYTISTNPIGGALSGTPPNLVYVPNTNWNGSDSFAFKVNNGVSDSTNAIVSVYVTPVNDSPTLDGFADVVIDEDAGWQTINLTGVSPGPTNETDQIVTIRVTSSNTNLVDSFSVHYTNGFSSGNFAFATKTNANGGAIITVVAQDNGYILNGGVDSTTNQFFLTVIPENDPPVSFITQPQSESLFIYPSNVTIKAHAVSVDGTITSLVFYADTTLLSTVTNAPYQMVWTNPLPGNHVLTTRVTDTTGVTTTSAPVNITVSIRADTDYDGRNDLQEISDGTNPTNSVSVKRVRLGYWSFDTVNWPGNRGQLPIVTSNCVSVADWSTNSVTINDASGAILKYADVENDGQANINLKNGSIRFWFRPDWGSTNVGGNGPNSEARLVELGRHNAEITNGWWALYLNTNGTSIQFAAEKDGVLTNYLSGPISWNSNSWHQIVLTYSPSNSALYVDTSLIATGGGVSIFPGATVRSQGFTIGSDSIGGQLALGQFDELETFNYPLTLPEVQSHDTDNDGLTDSFEFQSGLDPKVWNDPYKDSDFDGRSDIQEQADGTNPLDASSVIPLQLGYWTFDTNNWIGVTGEIPLQYTGITNVLSWDGLALHIGGTNTSSLTYKELESGGKANITCFNGSLSFWFRPAWSGTNAGGTGPETWASLISMGTWTTNASVGYWALAINPSGTEIHFMAQSNGVSTNMLMTPISWETGVVHHVVLTYSPASSQLYLDGQLASTGSGALIAPSAEVRSEYGFTIGNQYGGGHCVNGDFDDLGTYNYPLSAGDVFAMYQSAISIDSDGDGLSNILEISIGTNPYNPDTDADGLSDAFEYLHGMNPLVADDKFADPDYDGRNNLQEQQEGTDPNDPDSGALVRLGYWRFNNAELSGEAGQLPVNRTNAVILPSWNYNSLYIGSNSVSALAYRDVETNGNANINLRRGTLRFWFKPNWGSTNAGGNGPGSGGMLISVGNYSTGSTNQWWGLYFDATGGTLNFGAKIDAIETNYLSAAISWQSNIWHEVVLTYDTNASALFVDGAQLTNGVGAVLYPDIATRSATGFNIGSNPQGLAQANGEFDELETFNYVLGATEIDNHFDSDHDGLPDAWEMLYFGNLNQTADGDFNNNGISNLLEWQNGTNPVNKRVSRYCPPLSSGRIYIQP